MSELKHTPGPWEIDPHSGGHDYELDIKVAGGGWFLRISPGYPFSELYEPVEAEAEFKANVRLIAAAPELLEALSGLVEIIDKAGLINLSNGVQLGATSWYVKASDKMEYARSTVAKATTEEGA